MTSESWKQARRKCGFEEDLARKSWFHSFELPDGTVVEGHNSLSELRRRVAVMPIPDNLTGKRVLDIGAWDGWFSFEMERRGASVTAIDCVDVPTFREIHAALHSRVEYRVIDLFDFSAREFGRFDLVLFLSVLYHLKHPLLALERVCSLTTDLAIVSSFITDDYTHPVEDLLAEVPRLEFYETDELGGNLDNWCGPNLACVMAMCRAAGFARVELLEISGPSCTVACRRRYRPPPRETSAPPGLLAATHSRNGGINFRSIGDEYVSCWFECDASSLAREDVWPQVGEYGVPCMYVRRQSGDAWQANFRLPPGLDPGWYPVGVRLKNTAPSETCSIAVDIPLHAGRLAIHGVCDAFSAEPGLIRVQTGRAPSLCVWVAGASKNADRNNVHVKLSGIELRVESVTPSEGDTVQVNASFKDAPKAGAFELTVTFAGVASESIPIHVVLS